MEESAKDIQSEEVIETVTIESDNENEHSNSSGVVDSDEEELVDKQTNEEDDQQSELNDTITLETPGLESGEDQQSASDNESGYEDDTDHHFDIRQKRDREVSDDEDVQVTRHRAFMTNVEPPICYKQAMRHKFSNEWNQAIQTEWKGLLENETFELVDRPKDRKIIKVRWVFAYKRDDCNRVVSYKARLVAKGYDQKYGIDFHETFAPVTRLTTIRVMAAITMSKQLHWRHFDVTQAFLKGSIDEDIFIEQPEGFIQDNKSKVYKLKKSLYGLKQAARQWNIAWRGMMQTLNFKQLISDACVYVRHSGNCWTALAIYVDDIVVTATHEEEINQLFDELKSKWDIKDLGTPKLLLGVNIETTDDCILLHQRNYVERILEHFGMSDCKPISTPMDLSIFDSTHDTEPIDEHTPYANVIGKLLYLSNQTRPDITFAVNFLARFMSKPAKKHWVAAKRVLRYLKGTTEYGITIRRMNDNIVSYCDSDFANEIKNNTQSTIDKAKPTFGYVVMMNGAPIDWISKKNPIVTLSTMEAEYIAASETGKSIVWLRQLLEELDFGTTFTLKCDNQAAIRLLKNPEFYSRSKHISLKFHWIRSHLEEKSFAIEYVPTNENIADIMTKPLARPQHQHILELMNIKTA